MSDKNIGVISLKGKDYKISDIDLREEFNSINNELTNLDNKITEEVSKIVANAPEDFDTLKEMSDWISEHKDDATAMNTAILENKRRLDNALIFSSEEKEVGEWIDGNKIYRKCFEIETTNNDLQKVKHGLIFKNIISIYGTTNAMVNGKFGQSYIIGKIDNEDIGYQIYVTVFTNEIQIRQGVKCAADKYIHRIIVEYTKE